MMDLVSKFGDAMAYPINNGNSGLFRIAVSQSTCSFSVAEITPGVIYHLHDKMFSFARTGSNAFFCIVYYPTMHGPTTLLCLCEHCLDPSPLDSYSFPSFSCFAL